MKEKANEIHRQHDLARACKVYGGGQRIGCSAACAAQPHTAQQCKERANDTQSNKQILEMVEEGVLDKDNVILACLKYMSEDEVADMAHINEFFNEGDEE